MAEEIRRETTTMGTTPGGPPAGYGTPYGGGGPVYGGPPAYAATSGYGGGAALKPPIFKRVSWAAIFAGTFVALALSVLLWLLGTAIGLAAFDPRTPPGQAAVWGLGIWGILVTMISLFCGGIVAAWLAAFPKWMDAMLHGLVVWGLTTTAAVLFGAFGATVFAGGMAAMGPQLATGPQQQWFAVGDIWRDENPRERVRDELKGLLPTEDDWFVFETPEYRYTERDVDMLVSQLEQGQRQQLLQILIRDGDMDRQQAQRRIEQWENVLHEGRETRADRDRLFATPERDMRRQRDPQQPTVTDREAVNAATAAATWAFFALLLGACAAAVGGAIGRPQYMEDRIIQGGHPRYTPPGYQHGGQTEYREYRSTSEGGRYQPPPSY
jgi:hypothetical protein